jgi:16S rRNA (guanine527-N7)-methyltransferase
LVAWEGLPEMRAGEDVNAGALDGDLARLLRLVGAAGGSSDEGARERLRGLAGAIGRWNQAINLVSRKDIGRLIGYHFCDSASILPLLGGRLAGGVGEAGAQGCLEVLDVGGSNGLPGMVLAAVLPRMRLMVCDSRRKRLGFLGEVCRLGETCPTQEQVAGEGAGPGVAVPLIANGTFELGRVESQEFQTGHRASFDVIVARAVTRLRLLARWCLPLLKPGGRLVAYKGSRGIEELTEAEAYLFEHGAGLAAVTASPWGDSCNPLRLFAIVDKT